MGRTFRASSRVPSKREPLKEEKTKVDRSERDRPERPGKPEKKSLQDACLDLKKAAVERLQEQVRQKKKVVDDVEFEQLLAMIHGPQIDPRGPLLKFEGQRIPKSVFEDLLFQTFQRQSNRLPLAWESSKDYMSHCVHHGWVEMDDTAVVILPVDPAVKIEAA